MLALPESTAGPCDLSTQVQSKRTCSRSSGETSSVPRALLKRQYTSGRAMQPPAASTRCTRKSASCIPALHQGKEDNRGNMGTQVESANVQEP